MIKTKLGLSNYSRYRLYLDRIYELCIGQSKNHCNCIKMSEAPFFNSNRDNIVLSVVKDKKFQINDKFSIKQKENYNCYI